MTRVASSWQRPCATPHGRRGFTLLELTVAMTFVALLAGGIVLSISTCLNVWRRSLEAADLNQEARAVLEMISRDVRGATLGPDRSSGLFQLTPAGQGYPPFDVLEVSTESSSVSRLGLLPDELLPADQESQPPVTDYVQVRYEWQDGELGWPAGLYRTIAPAPAPVIRGTQPLLIAPTNAELISSSVTELRFRCYDNAEWFDEWDAPVGQDRLPAVVLVELAILDQRQREHEFRTLIPIAVGGAPPPPARGSADPGDLRRGAVVYPHGGDHGRGAGRAAGLAHQPGPDAGALPRGGGDPGGARHLAL